jgi:hypothetical protein
LGCGAEAPERPVLPVKVHTLPLCDLPAATANVNLMLQALGDFEATNESAEILPLDRAGAALRFPSATLAVEARVEAEPRFWGYGERDAKGLDVLLWPRQATCVLFRPDGSQGYPGKRGGQALAFDAGSRSVLSAGGSDSLVSDAIVGALVFNVATGSAATFDTSESGVLRRPRAFATATSFADKLLVAGGENPLSGVGEDDSEPRSTAEVFDVQKQRFTDEIELQSPRTRHAALTLPDGRTLLIGGRTKAGASRALGLLETVDPEANRADIGEQIAPRVDPRALVLSDGRVFIGGGTTLDGRPVSPPGELLSRHAKLEAVLDERTLPLRLGRAFAALPGGGVLAVGGCEDREPDDGEIERCTALCERGCPAHAAESSAHPYAYDAHWLDARGVASEVNLSGISAPRPILLAGSDGSPWLIAATAMDPETPALFRFNPWTSSFSAVSLAAPVRLPRPGYPAPVVVAPDAFVWLDDDGQHGELLGLRLGTRNRFTQDTALVLQADELDSSRPLHLAPDRPVAESPIYDGTLWLDAATEPVMVAVTDTDYADITVAIHLLDVGKVVSVPPRVLLGDVELGGDACPWPDGDARDEDALVATVTRAGASAELRFHGGRHACPAPDGRISLGFRAADGVSVIRRVDVRRRATPGR